MKKVALLTLFLLIQIVPASSEALTVTIKQTVGSTTTTLRTLGSSTTASPGASVALRLLTCTAPCTQTLGNFEFKDISSTQTARILKTDGSSSDKLELKGVQIRALGPGSLQIVAETFVSTSTGSTGSAASDLTWITGGTYPIAAALAGTFTTTPTSTTKAGSCNTTTFCVKLRLDYVGNIVNTSPTETTSTVSAPPLSTTGSFGGTANTDSENIPCGTLGSALSCKPKLKLTLDAKFVAANETLKLPGSGTSVSSNVTVEDGGNFFVATGCGDECGLADNVYTFHSASGQDFVALCSGASCGKTFTKNGAQAGIPLQFVLAKPTAFVPEPLSLVAIKEADLDSAGATPFQKQLFNRAFLMFIAKDLDLRKPSGDPIIQEISFDQSAVTTGLNEVDNLGQSFTFLDCSAGSFTTQLRVNDKGTIGTININMGIAAGFKAGCSLTPSTNLVALTDARVEVDTNINDATPSECCFTFADAVKEFSKDAKVESISLVVDSLDQVNNLVKVSNARVAFNNQQFDFTAQKATDFELSCDLPDGPRFRITKTNGVNKGATQFIEGSGITVQNCAWKGVFKAAKDLVPEPGLDNVYDVQVILNGNAILENSTFTITTK